MTVFTAEPLVDMYDAVFVEGGFTAFLTERQGRYVVAANSDQTHIPAASPFAEFAAAVNHVVTTYPEAEAVGGWVSNGRLYIEPVETYKSKATALSYAADREQAAVYDLKTGEEIEVR